jgi:DNA-binding transcriptional LysR family regulator
MVNFLCVYAVTSVALRISLRQRFPKVELVLDESTTASILTRLEANTLDLGLVRFPVLHPGDSELTRRSFF